MSEKPAENTSSEEKNKEKNPAPKLGEAIDSFMKNPLNTLADLVAGRLDLAKLWEEIMASFSEKSEDKTTEKKNTDDHDTEQPKGQIDMSKVSSLEDVYSQMDKAKWQKELGEVPIAVMLGQMTLESRGKGGVGLSGLAKNYNNLLGIKYKSSMRNAKPVNLQTQEQNAAGVASTITDAFAHFNTPEDCFEYYAKYMMNPHDPSTTYYGWFQKYSESLEHTYAVNNGGKWSIVTSKDNPPTNGVKLRGNAVLAIAAIRESGYATDIAYVGKVVDLLPKFGVSQQEIDAGYAFLKQLPKTAKPIQTAAAKAKQATGSAAA